MPLLYDKNIYNKMKLFAETQNYILGQLFSVSISWGGALLQDINHANTDSLCFYQSCFIGVSGCLWMYKCELRPTLLLCFKR